MTMHLLEELHCAGSFYEMGQAQGTWLKPRFLRLYESLLHNLLTPRWVNWIGPRALKSLFKLKGRQVRRQHMVTMQRFSPSQVERIRGIADTSALGLPLLLGLGSIETQAAHFQFVLGCSSLAVSDDRAQNGEPVLVYNHDFPTFLREHLYIRHSAPTQGFPSVQLSYPTIPGCIAGINASGLAISLNHAFSTEPFNHGVPPTYLVQESLDHCKTAGEVLEKFRRATFSCGSMATVIDETGRSYAMELSREHFGYREPEHGLSLTLNDYQVVHLKNIEVPQHAQFNPRKYPEMFHGEFIHRSNWERRERYKEILSEKSCFSVDDLKGFFSDHEGQSVGGFGTICRHDATSDTIATAVLYPKERIMEAGRGHPCKTEYQRFTI